MTLCFLTQCSYCEPQERMVMVIGPPLVCTCTYYTLNTLSPFSIDQSVFSHHMDTPQWPVRPHHMIHG